MVLFMFRTVMFDLHLFGFSCLATNYERVAFPEECHLSKFKNRSHGHSSMKRPLIQEK